MKRCENMAKNRYKEIYWIIVALSSIAMLIVQFLPVGEKDQFVLISIFFVSLFLFSIAVIELIRDKK